MYSPKTKKVKKLTSEMLQFCELELENPKLNITELAKLINKPRCTVYSWVHSPCYIEYRTNKLKEMWKDSLKKAQSKMLDLVDSPDDNVALKASSYILDSNGYKATEKIELNNNIIKVTLEDELEM